MRNMSLKKTPMPEQNPEERVNNFKEVFSGYTPAMAMEEAKRCLKCKNKPCTEGCPVKVRIPDFMALVAEGKFEEAYKVITDTNTLPAICGRVCPQETQCESKCIRSAKGEAVAIGRIERFVADYHMQHANDDICPAKSNGKKVAIVGSGPSGLTAAAELSKKGYSVTIYEAFHTPGGVLVYGIPEFRLPKAIVAKEIEKLEKMGVTIVKNVVVGKTILVDELLNEFDFDAVYIASGAGLPSFLKLEGENLNGIYSANEFLTRINLMKGYEFPKYDTPVYVGKDVAVFGGGNVAMDAARSAKRLGAQNVYIVYRRSFNELPARAEEVMHAQEEGIKFMLLKNPTKFISDENGWVCGVELIDMELGEPDESGRRSPVPVKDSQHMLGIDTAVIAIGQSPNPLIKQTTEGLETNKRGCIVADENGATTKKFVYAGGDAVTGAATVILAMGAGRTAAAAIDEELSNL